MTVSRPKSARKKRPSASNSGTPRPSAIRSGTCADHRPTRAALLSAGVIARVESVRANHFCGQVGRLGLEFLEANQIGLLGVNPGKDALAPYRAYTIEIGEMMRNMSALGRESP